MNIKTMELLPPQTRVLLKKEMRRKLFSDKKVIAKLLNISVDTVGSWAEGRAKPTKEILKQLGADLISENFLSNMLSVGTKKTQFSSLPREIDVTKFAWLVGIMEGDRAGNKNESIGLTNTNKILIKKFIKSVENLNIRREWFVMNVNVNRNMNVSRQEISQEFGIPPNRIFITVIHAPLKKPLFQIFLMNRVIAGMFNALLNIFQTLKERESLRKFIQGFVDAEGSVLVKDKAIEIRQKNSEEGKRRVLFITKSLAQFQIKSSIEGPNCENMLIIRILGGKRNIKNLQKFKKQIGFSHPEKKMKLEQILNGLS